MAQVVATNIHSLNAQRTLNGTNGMLQQSLERLSSGLRINSAKDDAAGIAIASRFQAQIRGYNQGARNAADAISLAQTAEGALNEIVANVQRIRELAVQSANGSNSSTDRTALQTEVSQLKQEITRVTNTEFNGIKIIGASAQTFAFQVGPEAGAENVVSAVTQNITSIGGYAAVVTNGNIATVAGASTMIASADTFLQSLNTERANLGAIQNRFESIIRNAENASANLSASRSRVEDADFAQETAKLTKAQILQQAGISVLAQSNALPQSALSLLG